MAQLADFGNFGSLAKKGAAVLVVATLVVGVTLFRNFVIIVDQKKTAVLVRLTGKDLPEGAIIAPDGSYKGIQLATLGEGYHFRDGFYTWDWRIVEQVEIPAGKVGVLVRQHGEQLAPGQVLALDGQKGIVRDVLEPGRYRINPYAESIELHNAIEVPGGYIGVVTLLAGDPPKDSNVYVVTKGERGVQSETLPSGTYYLNPYYQHVEAIDTRSQKFDMSGANGITFPSVDGFTITMEGTIEWQIERDRISEVFVKYVDDRKSKNVVMDCIIEKVILPNARSFSRLQGSRYLARELLGGQTRQKFQEDFHRELARACAEQGIIIREAIVRSIVLPDQIAGPIRDREIAVRQRDKFEQEKERERTEKELAMKKKLEERQRLLTQAEAQVSVAITGAARKRDVALIEANRALEVAGLELSAADNQAQARLARGEADADVVRFQNKAAARGLAEARAAFGDPDTFVRYLFYTRLAPSMRQIVSNTDGPFLDILQSMSMPSSPPGGASLLPAAAAAPPAPPALQPPPRPVRSELTLVPAGPAVSAEPQVAEAEGGQP
jgi:hypothetical protein